MRILMVLIPDPLGDTSTPPELTLGRVAVPYYIFTEAGIDLALASPEGGSPRLTRLPAGPDELTGRLLADRAARDALSDTLALAQVHHEDFAGAYCVGLPGALWRDGDDAAAYVVRQFLAAGKPVAIVPSRIEAGPYGSDAGLLIIGEEGQAAGTAAYALLGALARPD